MKRITKMIIAGSALCLGLTAVAAQSVQTRSPKGELVYQLVMKWGPFVSEAYRTSASKWATQMGPIFAKADVATLERALSKRTFTAMNDSLIAAKPTMVSTAALEAPQTLGDPDKDLVFVPIPPCRIFDTRAAIGFIPAGTTRGIDVTVTGNYSFQGGSSTNCSGAGAAGSFAAVVVNFTSVQPASNGYFTAFPFGTTAPLAATQVFSAGGILSNLAIVQLDQSTASEEMSIFAEKDLHLVGDMVGYYIEATKPAVALECVDTAETSLTLAPGGVGDVSAPACAAGYTQTATNCRATTYDIPFVLFRGGMCSAKNATASSHNILASRTCCRVPAL